jgi:hypothetical protein
VDPTRSRHRVQDAVDDLSLDVRGKRIEVAIVGG